MIKAFVRTVLAALGYEVRPLRRGKPSPIHLWEEHLEFNDRYEQIVGHTVVSKQRCFILYQFAKHVASVPGDVAEVGVYKGGTAKLLATTLGNTAKSVHLFDTFTGMPATDPKKDWHKAGVFGDTSLESVAGYLRDCGNTHLHAGFFPDTAQVVEKETFCFVHVDCDIY
ncbi:MAG: hypothetical protein HY318_11755, partial [Armatimonadetes bacterium]|nr:hypothetical protein [Armatimonadota bacterium]